MKLYAIKNINTGKLVTDITSPSHSFWKNRKTCENALTKCKQRVLNNGHVWHSGNKLDADYILNNYKVVTFELKEVEE